MNDLFLNIRVKGMNKVLIKDKISKAKLEVNELKSSLSKYLYIDKKDRDRDREFLQIEDDSTSSQRSSVRHRTSLIKKFDSIATNNSYYKEKNSISPPKRFSILSIKAKNHEAIKNFKPEKKKSLVKTKVEQEKMLGTQLTYSNTMGSNSVIKDCTINSSNSFNTSPSVHCIKKIILLKSKEKFFSDFTNICDESMRMDTENFNKMSKEVEKYHGVFRQNMPKIKIMLKDREMINNFKEIDFYQKQKEEMFLSSFCSDYCKNKSDNINLPTSNKKIRTGKFHLRTEISSRDIRSRAHIKVEKLLDSMTNTRKKVLSRYVK